jgi:cation diffusion facilitator family transporter
MHPWAWIFPFIAVIILEASYRILMRTAKRVNSPALAADAVHYRIDGITSLCAMFALMGAAYYPHHGGLFDHIGAILIACFMIGIGFYATRDNFHQLMDKTPDANYFNLVQEVARKVKGVKGTEKIRIQLYGPDAHIDIDVEVEPDLSVRLAHQISQQVRAAIQKAWPAVRDVTVHIEPYYANDH